MTTWVALFLHPLEPWATFKTCKQWIYVSWNVSWLITHNNSQFWQLRWTVKILHWNFSLSIFIKASTVQFSCMHFISETLYLSLFAFLTGLWLAANFLVTYLKNLASSESYGFCKNINSLENTQINPSTFVSSLAWFQRQQLSRVVLNESRT